MTAIEVSYKIPDKAVGRSPSTRISATPGSSPKQHIRAMSTPSYATSTSANPARIYMRAAGL